MAISICALVLVHELSQNPLLSSPSWNRKRFAWILLLVCEGVAMFDRIYIGGSGRWTALIYISFFTLAVAGMTDSYRMMLKDLSVLKTRLESSD